MTSAPRRKRTGKFQAEVSQVLKLINPACTRTKRFSCVSCSRTPPMRWRNCASRT